MEVGLAKPHLHRREREAEAPADRRVARGYRPIVKLAIVLSLGVLAWAVVIAVAGGIVLLWRSL